ncbi:MAG TPA: protein kinase family protein, partial [Myxococcaceae bacterium]|nr:protein kinase family protein [Myxococcaceae bacterium]
AAAHKEGVLHRDLKPSNVMLVPVHGGERAVVTDFGIAQAMEGRQAAMPGDGPAGTPAYMAPEQVTGWELSPATDLYSLGVLMLETTTGTLPSSSRTLVSGGGGEQAVSAPRARGGTRRKPRLSRQWKQLSGWCLATEPARRPQSVEAFLRALRRQAVRGRRPSLRLRGAVALLAALLAALVLTVRRSALTKRAGPLTVVVADLENTTGDPQLDSLSGLLVTSLEQSHALNVLTRASLLDELRDLGHRTSERIDESLAREVARRTGASLVLVGTVSHFDETYAIDVRVLDPAARGYLFTLRERGAGKSSIPDLLDRVSEEVRRSVSEPADQVKESRVRIGEAVTRNLEAYRSFHEGGRLEADGRYGQALARYRDAVALDPAFAMAHLAIAGLLETRDAEGARAALEQARRLGSTAPERERLIIRAFSAANEGRIDEALGLYQEVQRRFPRSADAFVRAADLVRNFKGDNGRAIELLRTAAELESGSTPNLVQGLIFARRYEEAAAIAERFAARAPGPEAFRVLTKVRAYQGRVAAALETARRAVAADVPLDGVLLQAYLRGHALDEAESVLRKTIDSSELPQFDRRAAYVNLATVLGYEGRWKEASAVLDRAVEEVDGGRPSLELLWNRAFLSGGLGAGEVRSATEELLRGGHAWSVCAAGILAYLGEPQAATGVLDKFPRDLRESPCGRIAEGVIAWRQGYASVGLRHLGGIDLGTEQLYVGAMLLDAGRPEEALGALEKFDRQTVGWLSFYAWGAGEASYIRAIALERLGRRAEALEVASKQLRTWEKADSGLPSVQRMRELAVRLGTKPHG